MKENNVSGMESLNSLHVKKCFRAFSVHQENRGVKESNNFENKGFVFTQSDNHWHFCFMRMYLNMLKGGKNE